jgi:hypothetical protein
MAMATTSEVLHSFTVIRVYMPLAIIMAGLTCQHTQNASRHTERESTHRTRVDNVARLFDFP